MPGAILRTPTPAPSECMCPHVSTPLGMLVSTQEGGEGRGPHLGCVVIERPIVLAWHGGGRGRTEPRAVRKGRDWGQGGARSQATYTFIRSGKNSSFFFFMIFLMWTILKVFIEFVTLLLLFL